LSAACRIIAARLCPVDAGSYPVKHGLVSRVCDWPHSSFHRDVRAGLFPKDWAGAVSAEGSFGERV
jgi:hypothetical protein